MTKTVAPIYTPAEVKEFIDGLPEKQLKPLWTQMSKMVPPMPNPKASVTQWKYKECEPLLLKSGDIVEAEDAERRVLMLINKTMSEFPGGFIASPRCFPLQRNGTRSGRQCKLEENQI
jgi:gentisate 1,2-dioxygenase